MRIRIIAEGADQMRQELLETSERVRGPLDELLAALGQDISGKFQENIRTEGRRLSDRGITWPRHHPVTVKIREYYRHQGKGRLIRSSDLLHSIAVLDRGRDSVDVGSRLPYAAVVHHGGEYEGRKVQAFPFLVPSNQDLADWEEIILDFLFPPEGLGA